MLAFVGLKMVWLNSLFGGKFPITASLAIIGAIIGASVVLSLLFPRKHADVSEASPVAEIAPEPPRDNQMAAAGRSEGPKPAAESQLNSAPPRKKVSRRSVRVLRKVIAIYLLLLGLGLMLRAAFSFGF